MSEPVLRNGDYVLSGGGIRRAGGNEAVLERVGFRLRARRGRFPFLPGLGSRLHQLGAVSPGQRRTAAEQYVAEALADEPVRVEKVELEERPGPAWALTVTLALADGTAAVELTVQ